MNQLQDFIQKCKKIIKIFKKIKDYGNTLIIIEHDREMINAADNIINLGHGFWS